MKIVLATGNMGKVEEFKNIVQDSEITFIVQSELGVSSVEETGLTFVENALIKARHAVAKTGLPAIADDSGLVVSALNGEPGIYSARYAGEHGAFDLCIDKVLKGLEGKEGEQRRAFFYASIVYMADENDPTPDLCDLMFSLAYGSNILLNNSRLHLKKGYKYGIIASKSAGKTTMMRAIANNQVEGFPYKDVRTIFIENDIQGSQLSMNVAEFLLDTMGFDPRIAPNRSGAPPTLTSKKLLFSI